MFSFIYNSFIYTPLYNGLIAILAIIPGNDIGVSIIIFTILVKIALYPLSKKAILTQMRMKEIEPELAAIKEKNKDNKEAQARLTMELYKNKKLNPFSSIGVLLIQIPIIFALYGIFYSGGLPTIRIENLYSPLVAFATAHPTVDMVFLGIINLAEKSVVLALLAGITQFVQARLMAGTHTPAKDAKGFGADFARTMQVQTTYIFPFLMAFIAYSISGAIALYLVVSNCTTIVQEYMLRKHRRESEGTK